MHCVLQAAEALRAQDLYRWGRRCLSGLCKPPFHQKVGRSPGPLVGPREYCCEPRPGWWSLALQDHQQRERDGSGWLRPPRDRIRGRLGGVLPMGPGKWLVHLPFHQKVGRSPGALVGPAGWCCDPRSGRLSLTLQGHQRRGRASKGGLLAPRSSRGVSRRRRCGNLAKKPGK